MRSLLRDVTVGTPAGYGGSDGLFDQEVHPDGHAQEARNARGRSGGGAALREEEPGAGVQVRRPGRRLRRQADEGQVPRPHQRRRAEGEVGGGHRPARAP